MANNQNILKLLSALGGGASESYSQGNLQKVGGQPLLPKPQMSMPHALSPYAPGNQGGGPMAALGGLVGGMPAGANDGSKPEPNSTMGVVHPAMRNSPNNAAGQLAQYLTTAGASPKAKIKGPIAGRLATGMDTAAFLRGGAMSRAQG